MIALESRNLFVTLRRRDVLCDVSLQVAPGEVVGILGPNGAGKSTLLKATLGLVPVASGSVLLGGQALQALTPAERARLAAYVPQERDVAWPLSVAAIVALGRLPHRLPFAAPSTVDTAAIDDALAAADLAHLRHRPVDELSGGERGRVLIARALAQDAPLLLADEPTSGLDPAHQLKLLGLLRAMASNGRAVVISIHELHLAARWCDRLIVLNEGRVVAEGRPDAVLTAGLIRRVYGCEAHISDTPDGPLIVPLSPIATEDDAPPYLGQSQ